MAAEIETVEFEDVYCDRATPDAIHVVGVMGRASALWIPQSVVHEDSEVYREGGRGTLVIPEWWALQRGLI